MPEPAFSIRKATDEDAYAIVECLRAAFEPYRAAYTRDAYHDTVPSLDGIRERLASWSVLVATSARGDIVGTIASMRTSADEGHLRGMAVLPTVQNSGMAAQLLAAAERELRDLQCTRVSLDTTEPLQRAIRFYERKGYRPSGRVATFFGMRLIEYVKDLSSSVTIPGARR